MKKIILIPFLILITVSFSFAQNVGINADGSLPNSSAMLDIKSANKGLLIPRVTLTGTADATTIPSPATSLMVYNTTAAGTGSTAVTPGFYYWENAKWNRLSPSAITGTLIPFSSGNVLSGPSVTSSSPILMGFGNNTTAIINGQGESTSPPQAGGFSFVVPFNGVIQNLQVSADLLVPSAFSINFIGLQYDFQVLVSSSIPNNGSDHISSPYLTRPLTSSVRFGFPNSFITAGTFRSATNLTTGVLFVNAGDRVVLRVRTLQNTDPSASEVSQLSFSASLMYTHCNNFKKAFRSIKTTNR